MVKDKLYLLKLEAIDGHGNYLKQGKYLGEEATDGMPYLLYKLFGKEHYNDDFVYLLSYARSLEPDKYNPERLDLYEKIFAKRIEKELNNCLSNMFLSVKKNDGSIIDIDFRSKVSDYVENKTYILFKSTKDQVKFKCKGIDLLLGYCV